MFNRHPRRVNKNINIYNIYIDAYMVSEIHRLARVPTFLYNIIIYVIIAAMHPRKCSDSLLDKKL